MVRTPRCAVHGLLCGPLPRPRSRVMMRGATGMRDGVVAHDRQSTVGADCVGHFPRVSSWDGLVVGGFPRVAGASPLRGRSEEHTSELQSRENLVCRLL